MNTTGNPPVVWTIAGSDSGGGAGIQADLQTINSLGGHGCSVLTAITAQNTRKVSSVEAVPLQMVTEQMETLLSDLPPRALKSGMLFSSEIVNLIAKYISKLDVPFVLDPVMVATSGDALIQTGFLDELKSSLLGLAAIVTPNLLETEKLIDKKISQDLFRVDSEIESAADILINIGAKAVLIKGGDRIDSPDFSQDYFSDGTNKFWLTSKRIDKKSIHGTGCCFSSAIACSLAFGYSLIDSVVIAKAYVGQAIKASTNIGAGAFILRHNKFEPTSQTFPWITKSAADGRNRLEFPSCIADKSLGFYPIVSNADMVRKLVSAGVSTIQLRIKNADNETLETEIRKSIEIANQAKCRLFINDHWQYAIKYKAYGVHLGQEDLVEANLQAIQKASLRLGVSTHCHEEVARAIGVRPSYMAIGPIFATTTKVMRFAPQGLDQLKYWSQILDLPLVAIGGIFIENAKQAIEAGASSVAVVRDIANAENIEARCQQWQEMFSVSC